MSNMDVLFSDLDRVCALLPQAFGMERDTGLSEEDLKKSDVLLDFFMGTISTVFHKLSSIITGHKSSSLESFVRMHKRAVGDILQTHTLDYTKIVLPAPQGMVWSYPKTIEALNTLYQKDPPHETVAFLKAFSQDLNQRDRIALASTLARIERDDHSSETLIGLSDLFVSHALGFKTASTLFGNVSGLNKAYSLLSGMNAFYSQAISAANEIKTLETSIQTAIKRILKGNLIDQDSADIAAKVLRLLCARLRSMASLLVKMDTVEQNYVGCLQHLIRIKAETTR